MTKKNIIESNETLVSDHVDALLDEKDLTSVTFQPGNGFVPTAEQVNDIPKSTQPKVGKGEFPTNDQTTPAPIKFEEKVIVEAPKTGSELSTDYQYIRTNLYTITERSIEALNNLVQIADQSQHPRAYEVVALMVNSIANAQKDLMNIHKEKAKIEATSAKNGPEVVNNNLFVGNTAQLDEIIKNMSKKNDTE